MMAGRYAHAKQFNRHRRQLRLLRTRLGRLIPRHPSQDRRPAAGRGGFRDCAIARLADPFPAAAPARLEAVFLPRTRGRVHRQGQASAPYEFGVKVSVVTTNARAPSGQFVLHAMALPGNPYDGHTLLTVIENTQKLTGCEIECAYVDKGYRGHDAPHPRRVFISGQKRGVFGAIKRELRRRSAIEPVIGHMKAEGHLGRCYGPRRRCCNAVLTSAGYNFRRNLA
jgi:IS5 family transposase